MPDKLREQVECFNVPQLRHHFGFTFDLKRLPPVVLWRKEASSFLVRKGQFVLQNNPTVNWKENLRNSFSVVLSVSVFGFVSTRIIMIFKYRESVLGPI